MPSALRRRDVVVDAVAHHDAGARSARPALRPPPEGARVGLAEAGERAQAMMTRTGRRCRRVEPLARRCRLVGDDAELEPALAEAAQRPSISGRSWKTSRSPRHGAHTRWRTRSVAADRRRTDLSIMWA